MFLGSDIPDSNWLNKFVYFTLILTKSEITSNYIYRSVFLEKFGWIAKSIPFLLISFLYIDILYDERLVFTSQSLISNNTLLLPLLESGRIKLTPAI